MESLKAQVAPRKRRVSRNCTVADHLMWKLVAPRKRRVSRNGDLVNDGEAVKQVAPRKRRVSRN